MATRSLFNHISSVNDQSLLDDLVVESIQIHGVDMHYVHRTDVNYDTLYGEDPSSSFLSTTEMEMYIISAEGFEGDGDLFSKFGIELRDQQKLAVAKTTFENLVGVGLKPEEANLVYSPPSKALFEIKFVEHELPFYQLGATQFYVLTVEQFEYSHETFATGVPEVDDIIDAIDEFDEDLNTDNDVIETNADALLDWTEVNPFGDV